MRIGIHYGLFPGSDQQSGIKRTLQETAVIADTGDVHRFSLMDHWLQLPHNGNLEDPMLEGYTTLGYLAAVTSRIELGLLVTGVTYRNPALLAKTVATLDELSDGRAFLGIGAAWFEEEHTNFNVPFPPLRERLERVEEAVQLCQQMWSNDDGAFRGTHYSVERTICSPRPPRPVPILIGGSGEKVTLRLVAKYADACNLYLTSPDEVSRKLDVLRGHCDAIGRNVDEIEVTVLSYDQLDDEDAFLATAAELESRGVDLIELRPLGEPRAFTEKVVNRVLPNLGELSPPPAVSAAHTLARKGNSRPD